MSAPRLEQLLVLLKEQSEDPFILFAIAKEYEQLGQVNEAIRYYEEVLNASEEYLGAYYHWGQLLAEQGEQVKALEIFDKGIFMARKVGDQHALSELLNARINSELEL